MADVEHLTADDMARQRTVMASDRTLMAWIRTSLSMISFGFTIYKFHQYLYESGSVKTAVDRAGTRNMGSVLIVLGVAALLVACWQYRKELKQLAPGSKAFTLPLAVAGFLAAVGVLALLNLLFRIGPF
jgi:putative membrane protein